MTTRKRGLSPPTRKRGLPPPTRMGKGLTSHAPRKNAKSTINRVRDILYKTNKLLGDAQAVSSGKIAGRIERRLTGNIGAQLLGSNILKFFQKR
jgi:hypothetical protein